ncbi:hypothetical protein N0X72_16040 [Streptomyces carpaticus]|uniref:Uncharacterized protein n=2 Tax=Streptomyces TaxID=1883 RepID=A0A1I6SMT4_9ACTN|nr:MULTISPECIES: hypothetical protein [Streptomyces]UWM50392.1 hypothetical protein N0X72_16040 [Streptomyces carpaticus]SFS78253.1 hypothetical protein SAMN05444716_10428 [Streptomyces harbinensis]
MPVQPTHRNTDAAVFVAVLALGVLLIMSGSATPQEVAVLGSALGGLYAVWQRPPARLRG